MYHHGYSSHYPNYVPGVPVPVALPTPLSYFPPFQPPQPVAPPDPPEPAVTQQTASAALARLVAHELKAAGFHSAQDGVLARLDVETTAFLHRLFSLTHEYANLGNRASPIATDVLLACNDLKIPPHDLYKWKIKRRRKRKAPDTALIPPPSRSPSPDLLPSDDEDSPATAIPATLRSLPPYFPPLPPKHTYLQTPASPPKKAALPSLEKKLKTAALVQDSLQKLLTNTEDTMNQEDAELLGHIVNWEMTVQPRKRWRVGAAPKLS